MQLKQHLAENYLALNAYIGKRGSQIYNLGFQFKKETRKARTKTTQIMQKSENNKEQKSRKLKHKGNIRRSMKRKLLL